MVGMTQKQELQSSSSKLAAYSLHLEKAGNIELTGNSFRYVPSCAGKHEAEKIQW